MLRNHLGAPNISWKADVWIKEPGISLIHSLNGKISFCTGETFPGKFHRFLPLSSSCPQFCNVGVVIPEKPQQICWCTSAPMNPMSLRSRIHVQIIAYWCSGWKVYMFIPTAHLLEKPNRGEMDDCRHGACSPPLQSRCNPRSSKPVNWEKLRMSVNSVVITDCHLACNSDAWKSQPMQWKYSSSLSRT